jgi:serine/threonine protein kinase
MARLAHRYICRVFEIGIAEGITFIAMECIQGASLADVIHGAESPIMLDDAEATTDLSRLVHAVARREQSRIPGTERQSPSAATLRLLPIQQVVALMIKVSDAVQFAHEHGVLHRDLKPGNIMLRPDGEPAVMDFGLAKITEAGGEEMSLSVTDQIFGTIEYMAPEQAHSSKHVDERADVYALGAILYRLLTGARHFTPTDNLLADAQRLQTFEPLGRER